MDTNIFFGRIRLVGFLFIMLWLASCQKKTEPVVYRPLVTAWKFKKVSGTLWHRARVPGTVHTDLLSDSLIPDPFYGTNESRLQWIGKTDWVYETRFDVPSDVFRKKHVFLVFKGLDTYATVRLNGHLLLQADNMFRSWKVNVKKWLYAKDNRLTVLFRSPMEINGEKVKRLPYVLPADNDRSQFKVSVFTRKAPYQFGWDWGPRFVTCGIWLPVFWEAWNDMVLNDFQIYQQKITDRVALLKAVASLHADGRGRAALRLYVNDSLLAAKDVFLRKGSNRKTFTFRIPHPKLWWTNGMGTPYLYRFTLQLLQNGKPVDRKSLQFGIRTIEIVQHPDTAGRSFYIRLNGVPVFMKGANYIPQDNFLPRVSEAKYRKLMADAVRMHMNMLRVWGGGIYENDAFYDLCDKNGILVWQDFMFSDSFYPGDSAFLNNVKQEAVENVKRLRNHPCLALWCGNNEIQVAWERWGYQKKYHYSYADSVKIYHDYLKLFHRLLPEVVRQYDSGRFYWPSSPNSAPRGWKQEARTGDMHYWGVWWGRQPFSAYENNVGRFMSEYGFQSLPAYATIAKFAPDSERYLVSPVLRAHNKHPFGYRLIREYMQRDFKVPRDFRKYIITSQLLQAEGMQTAIEAYRRAMPRCMGSLFWQLDDCWPVASWSARDYYGRWKAFAYALKKLYAPVLVSPVYQKGMLKIFLVSDGMKQKRGQLKLSLMDFYGHSKWEKTETVNLPAHNSRMVFSAPFGEKLMRWGKNNVFLHVSLFADDSLLSENILCFVPPKDLKVPRPTIRCQTETENGQFEMVLSSPVFVKYVVIDYPADTGVFSDNYFPLLPGQPKVVRVKLENAEKIYQKGEIKIEGFY